MKFLLLNVFCNSFTSVLCLIFPPHPMNKIKGSIHDCGDMPRLSLHTRLDVPRQVSGGCSSHHKHLFSHRSERATVSYDKNLRRADDECVRVCRSIGIAWLIIILTGIPVIFSHGEAVYVVGTEVVMVKCVFLSDDGYNLPLFQVSIALKPH